MKIPSTLQPFLERYLPSLEEEMREALDPPAPTFNDLYGYLHYHLGWVDEELQPIQGRAGKRLRPVFCLLCCESCGGDWAQALPAAAAVELLHNFSLIHDDIEDGDLTRRGRPTVWALWGLPQALNAGDALYALALKVLLRLGEQGLPAEAVADALGVFDGACIRLTQGQFLDLRFEDQEQVTVEEYLHMIKGKTATLLAISCELGALVARAPSRLRDRMHAFGHHLGLAFQIQDDILGIWGDPEVTGKPVGADIRRRKKTLPLLHGLEQSETLRSLMNTPELSQADADRAVELLEATGSRNWAQTQAQRHTDGALAALESVDASGPAVDALRDLALWLLNRVQ